MVCPVVCPEGVVSQILIGHDNQRLMKPLQVRQGRSADFMAIRTPLGSTVVGLASCRATWKGIEADHYGLNPDEEVKVLSVDDERAMMLLELSHPFLGI